jgi:hypothetical protein
MLFEVSIERKKNERLSVERRKKKREKRKKSIYCKDFV